MKHLIGALAALLLVVGAESQASFLIEPYLGYHMGKFEVSGNKDDAKGTSYGGRLGFSQLGFQFGADYMGGNWDIDSSPKFKASASNLGVFVGYDFPILLRVYGSYFFDSKLKDSSTFEGNMIRLGVGFSPIPLLDINLEYLMGKYDKLNGSSLPSEAKLNMLGVTVSIPFTL
jgi:hypothetical protein